MVAIEVELLAGRYVATEHNDRWRAEWPPHPARFFSALVAALHDQEPVDSVERSALLWLERQQPPSLEVALEAARRDVRSVFVPVNDVTIVGDPEAALRDAHEVLARAESTPEARARSAAVAKARKEVDKREKQLRALVASQFVTAASPAATLIDTARALLPDRRTRQERTFPAVIPGRPLFVFLWPESPPEEILAALHRLCDRVTRIGHSSSVVRCAPVDRTVEPTLVPSSEGNYVLRVVGPGQLERLEEAFARHQAVQGRQLPARPQRYGRPPLLKGDVPRSAFTDDWIVFERIGGDRPLASRGSDLAVACRRALLEINGGTSLPAVLSGHDAAGSPTAQPHVAFVPLPWVGHQHADGSVQGVAVIVPHAIAEADRSRLVRLLARWEATRGDKNDGYAVELGSPAGAGRPLKVRLRRTDVHSRAALDPERWCRASERFLTATPIALDRHPGKLRSNVPATAAKAAAEAESSVADACERIGLPRPVRVSVSLVPLLPGAQHVRQFEAWPPRPGVTRRARVHAEIVFSQPVRGPVLLGAGRHFGLGLCLPVPVPANRGNDD